MEGCLSPCVLAIVDISRPMVYALAVSGAVERLHRVVCNIHVCNIYVRNIYVRNIYVRNIDVCNIDVCNIYVCNV